MAEPKPLGIDQSELGLSPPSNWINQEKGRVVLRGLAKGDLDTLIINI